MSYLIDTDISSACLQGNRNVFSHFMQYTGRLYISILSVAELYSWVYVTANPREREAGLVSLLSDITVLPVDEEIAR